MPVHDRPLFNREHVRVTRQNRVQRYFIVRLHVATVHDGDVHAVGGQQVGGGQRLIHHRPDGENRDVPALPQDLPRGVRRGGNLRHRPGNVRRCITWIAEAERAIGVFDGGAQQAKHLGPVLRRGDGHTGNAEHVGDVVQPHMGFAVFAHQTSTVHRKHDRELLQRRIVDNVVVPALQERRVDRHDRAHTARRQPGGERHAVSFGDSDIEEPIGECLCERRGAGTGRHGRRDHRKILPLFSEFGESLAVYGSVRRIRRGDRQLLAGGRIVAGRQRMPLLTMISGGKSLAFLGDHMDQSRRVHRAHRRERLEQGIEIVSVDRAEVAEAKLFEQHARRQQRLHALFPFPHERTHAGKGGRGVVHQIANPRAQPVVQRIALNAREVLVHRADVRCNRHLIVVQDDDDVTIRMPGVVEPLVRQP